MQLHDILQLRTLLSAGGYIRWGLAPIFTFETNFDVHSL